MSKKVEKQRETWIVDQIDKHDRKFKDIARELGITQKRTKQIYEYTKRKRDE